MPQRFKLLVVLLVLSNIGVGCVGSSFLRAMDQKYSALLAQRFSR